MDIEEYLDTFEKFTKDPTLEAMEHIMEKFGNPQKELKCIHVAGTNGKASTCEMLNSVLIKSGYKVGKFLSPHLITFNDGIAINNENITNEEIEEIITPMKEVINEYNKTHEIPVKWFEVITSLAIIYFAKQKCDIAIIETGLGGLLDCTNVVEPLISVITKIGYDHVDILGNTIEKIAEHKAGIIKQNSHTVFVEQEQEVNNVIYKTCIEKNNQLHSIKKEDITNYEFGQDLQKFSFKLHTDIEINLKGKVQTHNACEALTCFDILNQNGFNISEGLIKQGMKEVLHPARLEILSKNPLIVFDGGHNEDAIKNLRENIDMYYKDYKTRVYIVAVLTTKDYKVILKHLCTDKNGVYIFTDGIKSKPYFSKEELSKEAEKHVEENKIYKFELRDAINFAKKEYSNSAIIVAGSFYIYKEVVEVLNND